MVGACGQAVQVRQGSGGTTATTGLWGSESACLLLLQSQDQRVTCPSEQSKLLGGRGSGDASEP